MSAMVTALLVLHSFLRWVVIFSGIAALGGAVGGVTAKRPWLPVDNVRSLLFTISLDVQVLIGLVLYVISPVTRSAFGDMGMAMRTPVLRFFVVEHLIGMVVALALVHIGRVRLRKSTGDAQRHKIALVFFGLGLVVLLLSIPWPGMPGGRVLFRSF